MSPNLRYKGLIDDLRICDCVLSEDGIEALANPESKDFATSLIEKGKKR